MNDRNTTPMSLAQKILTGAIWAIILATLFGLGLIAHGQQTLAPFFTSQENTNIYVKMGAGSPYTTIHLATVKACTSPSNFTVILLPGANPTDSIGGQAGVCNGVVLIDYTAAPATTYKGNGTVYVAQGGGGGCTGPCVTTFNGRNGAVTLIAPDLQSAVALQAGCTTAGYAWNPATNTCTPSAVTAAAMQSAVSGQTGCTTARLAWNPATNTCEPGGGPPTGAAGGSLGGTYPNPDVVKVNGAAVPINEPAVGTDSLGRFVSASGAISAALLTGAGMQIGGDSICAGTGASNPTTNAFAYLLRPVIGGFWNATCRPADQLIDTTASYVNSYIAPTSDGHYPLAMIEDGTNDVTQYNTSANLQTTWQLMYLADIATNGIAYASKAYPSVSLTNWTAGGSWANDTTQGSLQPDFISTTNGNTLAYAATCASSCVGILDWPIWNGNGGTFTISLDGTPMTVPYGGGGTTFYAAGFNGATITAAGSTNSTFTKAAVRIPMSAGSHTVTVTVTSATSGANKVGVNYFAIIPIPSVTNPNVEAISLQHQNNVNDILSGTYTNYISALVTQAVTDGLNAYYANVRDAMVNTNIPINYHVAAAGTSFAAPQWVSDTSVAYPNGVLLIPVGSSPTQGHYTLTAGTYGFNVADSNTPLIFNYTTNCGADETAMFANCYADALHPNDLGHAVYASVIASSLPSRLVTGNNVPQVTYPTRNYIATNQLPSQMMTPAAYNQAVTGPGFYPGINYQCFVGQCYFQTMTQYGLTTVVPDVGGNIVWGLAKYAPTTVQPNSTSQLIPLLTMTGNGTFTSYASSNNFSTAINLNFTGSNRPSYSQGLVNISDNVYFYPLTPTINMVNTNNLGTVGIRYSGQALQMETGVGNSSVNSGDGVCAASDLWYMGDYSSGVCALRETVGTNGVHNFLFGLQKKVYTVGTLPAASSVPAGTELTVSDATSIAPGTCVGGSSHYVTAISDGLNWNCP